MINHPVYSVNTIYSSISIHLLELQGRLNSSLNLIGLLLKIIRPLVT